MKSLTYGYLPEYEDFEKQFYASFDVPHTGMYTVILNDTDRSMMEQSNIYPARMYDCGSMYGLLLDLVNAYNGSYWRSNRPSLEQMEWAGDFASSILFTLGYEWI